MLELIVVWVLKILLLCFVGFMFYALTSDCDGRYTYLSKIWKRKQQFDFYLAGGMRGYENKNKDMFLKVATLIREQGYTVFNPGEVNDDGMSFEKCMCIDLDAVVNRCNNIAFLPGWRNSVGANAEAFAAFVCGKEAYQTRLIKKDTKVSLKKISLTKRTLPYKAKRRS